MAIARDILDGCRLRRRQIHSRPELAGTERETSRLVQETLGALGFEIVPGMGETAVVALWPGQDRSRCVALRADMDALPLRESTGREWSSRVDRVMHACGHDGHTSILLGVAMALARRENRLPADVKLVFQPAEEVGKGALDLVRRGVLEKPSVEAMFGLHGWPGLPLGTASVRAGPVMASVDNFAMRVLGKGGHGAQPHLTVDPVVAAAQFITLCQSLPSRGIDPLQPAVLTFGQMQAGSTYNVIPHTCELKGTLRALDEGVRADLKDRLERLESHFFRGMGLETDFAWVESCPATINDGEGAELVRGAVERELGPSSLRVEPPSMASEDFSFFLERTPGAYFWLGLGEKSAPLHSPDFDFDDRALEPGIRIFLAIIEAFFERRGRGA